MKKGDLGKYFRQADPSGKTPMIPNGTELEVIEVQRKDGEPEQLRVEVKEDGKFPKGTQTVIDAKDFKPEP